MTTFSSCEETGVDDGTRCNPKYDLFTLDHKNRVMIMGNNTLGADLRVLGDIDSRSLHTTGGSLTFSSDIRLKKNVETLEDVLPKIEQLRGVSWDWRREEFPQKGFEDRKQVGVIAQEVEKVYPELVNKEKDGFLSVKYANFVGVLIQAIHEIMSKFAALEQKVADLARDMLGVTAELKQQRAEISELKSLVCADNPRAAVCLKK